MTTTVITHFFPLTAAADDSNRHNARANLGRTERQKEHGDAGHFKTIFIEGETSHCDPFKSSRVILALFRRWRPTSKLLSCVRKTLGVAVMCAARCLAPGCALKRLYTCTFRAPLPGYSYYFLFFLEIRFLKHFDMYGSIGWFLFSFIYIFFYESDSGTAFEMPQTSSNDSGKEYQTRPGLGEKFLKWIFQINLQFKITKKIP